MFFQRKNMVKILSGLDRMENDFFYAPRIYDESKQHIPNVDAALSNSNQAKKLKKMDDLYQELMKNDGFTQQETIIEIAKHLRQERKKIMDDDYLEEKQNSQSQEKEPEKNEQEDRKIGEDSKQINDEAIKNGKNDKNDKNDKQEKGREKEIEIENKNEEAKNKTEKKEKEKEKVKVKKKVEVKEKIKNSMGKMKTKVDKNVKKIKNGRNKYIT
jgi:hypothetical protein